MNERKELRNKAKQLVPILRIGKNGLSEGTIAEIGRLLKQKKLIKIKFLKNFIEGKDRKEIAKILTEKTSSEIIDFVGNVIVLYKTPAIENNINKKVNVIK